MSSSNQGPNGILIVNKPAGITSHGVVSAVRKKLNTRKVGHTGTLDPMATGVLPIVVGSASKLSNYIMDSYKTYRCKMILGSSTTTQDAWGEILKIGEWENISDVVISEYLTGIVGEIEQIPPDYSAIKIGGEKLIDRARRGEKIKNKKPRTVTIHSVDILRICKPEVEFIVKCSKGTYVRTICHDLGEQLGSHAHMTELVRLSSGGFSLEEAVDLDDVTPDNLLPVTDATSRIEGIGRIDIDGLNKKSKKMFYDGVKMDILACRNAVVPSGFDIYFVYFDGHLKGIAQMEGERLVITRGLD